MHLLDFAMLTFGGGGCTRRHYPPGLSMLTQMLTCGGGGLYEETLPPRPVNFNQQTLLFLLMKVIKASLIN